MDTLHEDYPHLWLL